MNVLPTTIPGLMMIEPQVFRDHRGYFLELHQQKKFEVVAPNTVFVQDNRSYSVKGTIRGLHGQRQHPQGKLISVIVGEIFDVVVDIRPLSSTFGRWESFILSADNFRQLFVPPGLAHGFLVMSEGASVEYKCTDFYDPTDEFSLLWNDPTLNIPWPEKHPLLSKKDLEGMLFADLKKKFDL